MSYPTRRPFCAQKVAGWEPIVEPSRSAIDLATTQVLGNEPFASVGQSAQMTYLPTSPVYYHLVNTLGSTMRHPRWVPHALFQNQRQVRVEMSKTFLVQVRSGKNNG